MQLSPTSVFQMLTYAQDSYELFFYCVLKQPTLYTLCSYM